jgi:hypothetical protein
MTAVTVELRKASLRFAARRLAIVGVYAGESSQFVRHAALLREAANLRSASEVAVWHMGPPVSLSTGSPQWCRCELIGQIELSNEEIEAIDDWIASVSTQYTGFPILPFQQYVVAPHMVWVKSEEGRPLRQRFSCVGYVIEAYRSAEIDLVDVTVSQLPLVDRSVCENIYPQLAELLDKPELAERLGIVQEMPATGPLPVLLPGYLFHSTRRFQAGAARPTPLIPHGVQLAEFSNDGTEV